MDPAIAIAGLFRFDFEGILADPIQLGIFLELAQTIIELEPRAREAAITLALAGKEIPGWSLVRREGNRFVESTHVQSAPRMPTSDYRHSWRSRQNSWEHQRESVAEPYGTTGRPMPRGRLPCGTTVFLTKQAQVTTTTNRK